MKRSLSSRNKLFYFLSVKYHRFFRYITWLINKQKLAKTFDTNKFKYRVYKHQSVLIRKLGDCDLTLQYNKVQNLKIAIKKLNGVILKPGEVFSFCRIVGSPTKRKGYQNGILLSNGEAKAGVGGGLCQITNLIHWVCLHSPLTITERHHHSFDPFPDNGRVVPFGSGATIFYNYMDFQLKNETEYEFQMLFWLDDKCINCDLRVNIELPYKYHVFEKNHEFIKMNDVFYRKNELWRDKYLKMESGRVIETEFLFANNSFVKYIPDVYKR